jgi:hypothetical protein
MDFYGAPGRSRTSDLLVRSQLLYPAELRAHIAGGMQLVKNNGIRGLEQTMYERFMSTYLKCFHS